MTRHIRLIAALAPAMAVLVVLPATASEASKKDELLRRLPVESPMDKSAAAVVMLGSEKEVADRLGEETAKKITGKIDFGKENLLRVHWGRGMNYEVKEGKEGAVIIFFNAAAPSSALHVNNGLFAVPKNTKWQYAKPR